MVWTYSLVLTFALTPEYYFQHSSSGSPTAAMGRRWSILSGPTSQAQRDKGPGKGVQFPPSAPSQVGGPRRDGAERWSWLRLSAVLLLWGRHAERFFSGSTNGRCNPPMNLAFTRVSPLEGQNPHTKLCLRSPNGYAQITHSPKVKQSS